MSKWLRIFLEWGPSPQPSNPWPLDPFNLERLLIACRPTWPFPIKKRTKPGASMFLLSFVVYVWPTPTSLYTIYYISSNRSPQQRNVVYPMQWRLWQCVAVPVAVSCPFSPSLVLWAVLLLLRSWALLWRRVPSRFLLLFSFVIGQRLSTFYIVPIGSV